jgi:hypothetical protein
MDPGKKTKLCYFSFIFVFLFLLNECLSADLNNYPQFLFNDIYAVVGADASVLDLAVATDIVANIKSEYPTTNVETKLDTELINPYSVNKNLILVGNACYNKFVAMIMGLTFPSCDSASGIPENSAIIKIYEDGFVHGYNVLLVAGWNGTYTRIAASVLQKHDQLLSGMSEKAVKVTSATSSGITPLSEQELLTTSPTTTIITTTTTSTSSTTMLVTTYTTSSSTTTTPIFSSNLKINIPKSFYLYSIIIIGIILVFSLIFLLKKPKLSEKVQYKKKFKYERLYKLRRCWKCTVDFGYPTDFKILFSHNFKSWFSHSINNLRWFC